MKGIGINNDLFYKIKAEEELIKESITIVLLTSPGERINRPLFGCILKKMVFNFESYILSDLSFEINTAISKWEPRVSIFQILVEKDTTQENSIKILLELKIKEKVDSFYYDQILTF